MQKLNCVLKMRINNDEVTRQAEKIKALHAIETKRGVRIYWAGYLHRKKVRKSMFNEDFKILLVSKS